jgi:sodium-coupled monocarboxylate transporter 8/12
MKGLALSDIIVFGVYLALSVGVGLWFTRQQKSLKSYLLADQDMNYVVVAISIIAAFFSGISYLGAPSETFHHDLRILWALIAFLIATPVTTLIFLPLFYRMGLVSVNEYLEKRFDRRLRVLASALFVLRTTVYLAIATYAPALVITAATGWPVWISVLLCGLSTTLYTALGGMKAVLWTDTLQFCVLFGGILVVLGAIGVLTPGGIGHAWQLADEAGRTRFWDFSLDPTTRVTVWAGLLGGAANSLVQMVTDQMAVQRYLTAKSLPEATRAMWFKLWITVPMVSLFYFTGTLLAGYYRAFPDRMPVLASPDALLPRFVLDTLPAPLPGLLIAAIFAATMSTVSAGINSLTGIVLVDFVGERLKATTANEDAAGRADTNRQVRLAKTITFGFGLLVTVLSCFVGSLGTLVEAPNRIFGILGGPLLGIFFLSLHRRRCTGMGAVGAMALGTLVCLGAMRLNVSFLWLSVIGAVSSYAAGTLLSFVLPQAETAADAAPPLAGAPVSSGGLV